MVGSSAGGPSDDAYYELGASFLRLPARATRDGDQGEEAVSTSLHVEVFGVAATASPPFVSLVFEPATGEIVDLRAVQPSTGFEGYEEVLWGMIGAYMEKFNASRGYKPATLTTTDVALADYFFGLLQGCGMDIVCVGARQTVAWPSDRVAPLVEAAAVAVPAPPQSTAASLGGDVGAASPAAASSSSSSSGRPLIRQVMDALVESLVESGLAASVLAGEPLAATTGYPTPNFASASSQQGGGGDACPSAVDSHGPRLVLIGACHDKACGKLVARSGLKRCSMCKKMQYCSAACQRNDWSAGHKRQCKEIAAMNGIATEKEDDSRRLGASIHPS